MSIYTLLQITACGVDRKFRDKTTDLKHFFVARKHMYSTSHSELLPADWQMVIFIHSNQISRTCHRPDGCPRLIAVDDNHGNSTENLVLIQKACSCD